MTASIYCSPSNQAYKNNTTQLDAWFKKTVWPTIVPVALLVDFAMNSGVIRRDGCSLNTEFIRAIRAALRRASNLVMQFLIQKAIFAVYYQ